MVLTKEVAGHEATTGGSGWGRQRQLCESVGGWRAGFVVGQWAQLASKLVAFGCGLVRAAGQLRFGELAVMERERAAGFVGCLRQHARTGMVARELEFRRPPKRGAQWVAKRLWGGSGQLVLDAMGGPVAAAAVSA